MASRADCDLAFSFFPSLSLPSVRAVPEEEDEEEKQGVVGFDAPLRMISASLSLSSGESPSSTTIDLEKEK